MSSKPSLYGQCPLSLLATVPDLINVSDDQPGWSRRRHGRGFRYFREDGSPFMDGNLPPAEISRAEAKAFGETFDVEEVIAYRVCSVPTKTG